MKECRFTRRAGSAVLLLALAAALGGCTSVHSYQRGVLAHPTMSADDPFTSGLDDHVRAVSEGAAGGLAGGGGGCGCN